MLSNVANSSKRTSKIEEKIQNFRKKISHFSQPQKKDSSGMKSKLDGSTLEKRVQVAQKKKERKSRLEEPNPCINEAVPLKTIIFCLSGLISIYPKLLMIAETAIMEEIYPEQNYSFFVVIPTYICVPPAFLFSKILSSFKIHIMTKIYTTLFLSLAFFTAIPILSIITLSNQAQVVSNYLIMLFLFFVSYIFSVMNQSYFMTILSVYDPFYTNMYFLLAGVSNILIMVEKSISYTFGFNFQVDFVLIWGTYFVCNLALAYFLIPFARTMQFRSGFRDQHSAEKINKGLNLKEAWRQVSSNFWGLIFSVGGCFLVFPGIYLSSFPNPAQYSQQKYILIINTLSAIFDLIPRPFAWRRYMGVVVKLSYFLLAISNAFVIYCFLFDFQKENRWAVYVVFASISFLISRTALCISYYNISATVKSDEETKEGVGVLMIMSIQLATALGNLLSNGLLVFRDNFMVSG